MQPIEEKIEDYIKNNYKYNPITGDVSVNGSILNYIDDEGYYSTVITLNNKRHYIKVHRIAWLLYNNRFPPDELDHIDGNRTNNKISNLREATKQQNQFNRLKQSKKSSSTYKGVRYLFNCDKWRATITYNKKQIDLGLFFTEEAAAQAYDNKALELFGEFAKTNFPNNGNNNHMFAAPEENNNFGKIKKIKTNKTTSSKYAGVYWKKDKNKWSVSIKFNNKRIFVGYFGKEMDAAKAFDKKMIELYGNNCRVNFPEDYNGDNK